MSSELQFNADTGCLTVIGELTIYQANALAEGLRSAHSTGALRRVDLTGVTEVDTAGLQFLLLAERLSDEESPLELVNYSHPVRDALQLSGMSRWV